jgi:hypothetical protein
MNVIKDCGVSDSQDFHTLWKLPNLPLTEQMGPYSDSHKGYDQELVISVPTGHVQLRNQLSPNILYTESEYSYRTGSAFSAERGLIFFELFLKDVVKDKKFNSILDVGGNDLSLMKMLRGYGSNRTVIDPVCKTIDGQIIDGIKVFGQFIENIDLSVDIKKPDLVICRHTMEHISRPKDVINQWFTQCDTDCIYLLEIPCFENLVESLRFDAIFHQHYHLFDLYSLKHLIWECGGEYISHRHYHQGSCGGSLIIAFKKAKEKQIKPIEIDLQKRINYFEKRISLFKNQMEVTAHLLKDIPTPIYGYGAGLMLATLGYHLNTDFSNLECILDDDPSKDGMTYRNLPVTVRDTNKIKPKPNSSFIITSMENIRPIYKRILELTPRRIISPLIS